MELSRQNMTGGTRGKNHLAVWFELFRRWLTPASPRRRSGRARTNHLAACLESCESRLYLAATLIDLPQIADPGLRIHSEGRVATLELSTADYSAWQNGSQTGAQMEQLTRRIYQSLPDDYDFIFVVNNQADVPPETPYFGIHIGVRNDTDGIGLGHYDNTATFGSEGRLQGVIHLPARDLLQSGPSLHELMHRWGNYLSDVNGGVGGHWGYSGVGGQLGGWEPGTLRSLGNGLYDADGPLGRNSFGTFASGGNSVPYSELELYLAGLIGPESVTRPIQVAVNGDFGATGADPATGVFGATEIRTLGIADIVQSEGARVPGPATSQRAFRSLVVLIGSSTPTVTEADEVDTQAAWLERPASDGNSGLYNFWEATGGRATLTANGLLSPFNTAPVLDNRGSPFMILGVGGRQSEAMREGTLVEEMLDEAAWNAITDVDIGAFGGIAITAIDKSLGTFQYALAGDDPVESDWIDFEAAGPITESSALLLPMGARMRFATSRVPHHEASGAQFLPLGATLDHGLTFRAWDQTTGVGGGRGDATTNGGSAAFSTASETVEIFFEARLYRHFNRNAELDVYTLEAEFNAIAAGGGAAFEDRSTSAWTGFTVLLSDIPDRGINMLPLYRMYYGVQFNANQTETDMGYRYLTTNAEEASFLEGLGPADKQPLRQGTYFREQGVNAGSAILGYVFSFQWPSTSELTQVYRTDQVDKPTRPPGTSEGATPTSFKRQENGNHVYTTNTAFETSQTGVWRVESTRGFARELTPVPGFAPVVAAATFPNASESNTDSYETANLSTTNHLQLMATATYLVNSANQFATAPSSQEEDWTSSPIGGLIWNAAPQVPSAVSRDQGPGSGNAQTTVIGRVHRAMIPPDDMSPDTPLDFAEGCSDFGFDHAFLDREFIDELAILV